MPGAVRINPLEEIPIVRQLDDPADLTTRYVRTYIRDSKTGELITESMDGNNFINLTHEGSHRFAGNFMAPPDPSWRGRWIDVETRVFNDSAYTVQNTMYGVQNTPYLVHDRPARGFGGGGGVEVDYDKIRKILERIVKNIPQPNVMTEQVIIDFDPVLKRLRRLQDTAEELAPSVVRQIVPKLDLRPLERKIEAIPGLIKIPETNLRPIQQAIKAVETQISNLNENLEPSQKEAIAPLVKQFTAVSKMVEALRQALTKTEFRVMPFAAGELAGATDPVEKPKTPMETLGERFGIKRLGRARR